MPNTAIQATGLVKWFGEGEARTMALREVSLEAQFGEMVYIVGPSGSGNTTLLSVPRCWTRWRRTAPSTAIPEAA